MNLTVSCGHDRLMNEQSDDHLGLVLASTRIGTTLVLTVRGELDLATLPQLDQHTRSIDDTATGLILDLSEVRFLASIGVEALVKLALHGTRRIDFAVVATNHAVLRPLHLLGLLDVLAVYPDLAQALTALTSTPPTPDLRFELFHTTEPTHPPGETVATRAH